MQVNITRQFGLVCCLTSEWQLCNWAVMYVIYPDRNRTKILQIQDSMFDLENLPSPASQHRERKVTAVCVSLCLSISLSKIQLNFIVIYLQPRELNC